MSGIDRVVYNLLEQLLSTDLNAMPQRGARTTLDALRLTQAVSLPFDGGAPSLRDVVLGGLVVTRVATGVQVAPGALLQPYYSGQGTAPSASDSQAQLGRIAQTEDVAIAIPVSDTWYLLQARVTELSEDTNRLVWNPSTSSFDVALLGVALSNVLEFSAKAGGADIPLPDAGWCPLAAVFVQNTGSFAASDVIDVRPLAGDQQVSSSGEEVMLTHAFLANYGTNTFPSTFLWHIDVDLIDRGGRRLFARADSDTAFPLDLNAIKRPGLAIGNATWYYLYLCRWSGCAPRNVYSGIKSEGLLLLSDVAPSVQGKRDNATSLTLPSPWNAYIVPAGQATCIGAVLSDQVNGAVLGFRGMSVQNGRAKYPYPVSLSFLLTPASTLAGVFPINCRGFFFQALADGSGAGETVLARVIYPAVSPVRRSEIVLKRSLAGIKQGYDFFDTRGIPVASTLFDCDAGVTFGYVQEMEF